MKLLRYPLPSRDARPSEHGYYTVRWTFPRAMRHLLAGGWFDTTAEFASRDDAFLCNKLSRLLELSDAPSSSY